MQAQDIKILIGFETSGGVRRAFANRGFDVWSCDLLPSDDPTNRHLQMDIREAVEDFGPWDMAAILHPPCTRLCNSGVRWLRTPPEGKTLEQMWEELEEACELFSYCLNIDVPRRAVENPVMHGHASSRITDYRKPQYVQPWHFGDEAFKATGLHLRGLPNLRHTHTAEQMKPPVRKYEPERHAEWSAIHLAPPGPERWKVRSKTFGGIAGAFAEQWGDYLLSEVN